MAFCSNVSTVDSSLQIIHQRNAEDLRLLMRRMKTEEDVISCLGYMLKDNSIIEQVRLFGKIFINYREGDISPAFFKGKTFRDILPHKVQIRKQINRIPMRGKSLAPRIQRAMFLLGDAEDITDQNIAYIVECSRSSVQRYKRARVTDDSITDSPD